GAKVQRARAPARRRGRRHRGPLLGVGAGLAVPRRALAFGAQGRGGPRATIGSVTAARDATFRLLFEHNPLPMWVYDVVTLIFFDVDAAAVEHYGYARDEFLTMKVSDLFVPEELARIREAVARMPQAAASAIRLSDA